MERPGTILANVENFGKIYRCGDCDNIHLQIGPVSVLLSHEAYMQLVALVNTSASNYEASVACSGADDHGYHG
jgi:hypothetical protein